MLGLTKTSNGENNKIGLPCIKLLNTRDNTKTHNFLINRRSLPFGWLLKRSRLLGT